MSTKTLRKRIALVAVSTLGFGLLSAAPSSAAIATGINLTTNSITVVGASNTGKALIGVTVSSNSDSTGLTAGETVTVSVIGVPTTVTTTKTRAANGALGQDLSVTETEGQVSGGFTNWTTFTADSANGNQSDTDGAIGSTNTGVYGLNQATPDASTVKYRTYFFTVNGSANSLDQGVYTLAVDLTNAQGAVVERETLKVDFVSLATDSGAIVTASSTGAWTIGNVPSIANQSSTRRLSATLRNRDNGAIRAANGSALALSVTATDSTATTPVVEVLSAEDDRNAEFGYSATQASNTALANDGNYSIFKATAFDATLGPATMTVRYGLASATASITLNPAAIAGTVATTSVVATGAIVGADANDEYLPLTTKSAVVSAVVTSSAGAIQTGYAVYYTVGYSASCVAGNMSPAANTVPVRVLTDNTGTARVTITNAFPLDTCVATVTWTGVDTAITGGTNVITWQKSAPTSAISNPGGNYQALFKSANTVSWSIVDQFGNLVTGVPAQVTITGANAPTVAIATKTTDANGQVSHTWTDALATATSGDSISVTSVNGVSLTGAAAGPVGITYKTALDVVASIQAQYQAPAAVSGSPAAVTVNTLVPATAIGGVAGILNAAADQLDLTGALVGPASGSVTGPWVRLVFTAQNAAATAVTGVPTTVKVSNGFLLNNLGRIATERIVYANDAIYILGLNTGVVTVTATNGSVTSTATINFTNQPTYPVSYYDSVITSNARNITASESNGVITAKVVDFYGNPVANATIEAFATGASLFANGGNSITGNQLLTDANGEVRIAVTGKGSVTVGLNAVVHPKTRFLAGFGDATGVVVTPGSKAGNSTAPAIATNGLIDPKIAQAAADKASTDAALEALKAQLEEAAKKAAADKASSDAAIKAAQDAAVETAQAAADLAAEATDAANAATDAANASAEAADAATAAAQDAADAVAALSTQVSEMIDSLKKQITALTNLVIKIQKKVKA
jgi:hypothetical protein